MAGGGDPLDEAEIRRLATQLRSAEGTPVADAS
jgi:hypothetical protein